MQLNLEAHPQVVCMEFLSNFQIAVVQVPNVMFKCELAMSAHQGGPIGRYSLSTYRPHFDSWLGPL